MYTGQRMRGSVDEKRMEDAATSALAIVQAALHHQLWVRGCRLMTLHLSLSPCPEQLTELTLAHAWGQPESLYRDWGLLALPSVGAASLNAVRACRYAHTQGGQGVQGGE